MLHQLSHRYVGLLLKNGEEQAYAPTNRDERTHTLIMSIIGIIGGTAFVIIGILNLYFYGQILSGYQVVHIGQKMAYSMGVIFVVLSLSMVWVSFEGLRCKCPKPDTE